MKYLFLLILLTVIGCGDTLRTDHNWIRSISKNKLKGATVAVEEKGAVKHDIEVLDKMKNASMTISKLLDSITIIPKNEILNRAQLLIDAMEHKTEELSKFYSLNEQSSESDFKLQLALLEFELLKHHSIYIGLRDISFDRMELIFIPRKIGGGRVTGELLFAASSNDLEEDAQMFINGKEIPIENRVGLIDIPTSELVNGKVKAKLTFKYAEFELEEDIEVIKE